MMCSYLGRFDRVASEDVTVQGIQVKKGTVVTASPWVIHRNSDIWEDPETFEPDRSVAHVPVLSFFRIINQFCIPKLS